MTGSIVILSSRRRPWIVAGIGAAVLLVAVVAMVPLLMQADGVQRAIEQRIAAFIGGGAHYESLSLRLLPRPRVEVRNLAIDVPGAFDGRIAVMDVRIALLPLIAGSVRPASIRIERPELTIRLSPRVD